MVESGDVRRSLASNSALHGVARHLSYGTSPDVDVSGLEA